MVARRWLLAILVLAALATGFPAVRAEGLVLRDAGRYTWHLDLTRQRCEDVRWVQVERWRTPGLCADDEGPAPIGSSCTVGCLVLSPYSREEAQRLMVDGITLEEHELRHAKEQMHHVPR